ncbi:hypothetical protein [Nocardia sp. NPDC004860]|uniref:hypothetical protein n=1 Tax=Nocardia sp. NPDC004860 TaxID=3154557 RepID=UPI0033BB2BA3
MPDVADRRKVVVEPIPDSEGRIEAVVAPPRDRIAAVLAEYRPEELEVLFDYFTRATVALREAAHDMLERRGSV